MRKHCILLVAGIALLGALPPQKAQADTQGERQMEITSKAFSQGGTIPSRHTCDGEDVSPPIAWKGVPEGTRSIALICEDPDAPVGTFVHWVYYDIPPSTEGLPEGIPGDKRPEAGGVQGINDFPAIGYGGPCPPSGVHRYFFRVYAVDTELELPPGSTVKEVMGAMDGHMLGMGELMGRYQRRGR
jgi:Raf kinase inhibitor-like YbhB/YbcL family protein